MYRNNIPGTFIVNQIDMHNNYIHCHMLTNTVTVAATVSKYCILLRVCASVDIYVCVNKSVKDLLTKTEDIKAMDWQHDIILAMDVIDFEQR